MHVYNAQSAKKNAPHRSTTTLVHRPTVAFYRETTLPSTDTSHPTSINTSHRTSIHTEPWDMVATIVLIQDATRNLHDHEGHLHNVACHKIDDQGAVTPDTCWGKYSMKRLLQLPSSRSLPPGSGFLPRVPGPCPRSGTFLRLPSQVISPALR